jgi:hypothetical protein
LAADQPAGQIGDIGQDVVKEGVRVWDAQGLQRQPVAQGVQLRLQRRDLFDLLQDLLIELQVGGDHLLHLQLGLGQHLADLGDAGQVNGWHALREGRGRGKQGCRNQKRAKTPDKIADHSEPPFTLMNVASMA